MAGSGNSVQGIQQFGHFQENAERCDDVTANYAPGDVLTSAWLAHESDLYCLRAIRKSRLNREGTAVDFGCGTGRHARLLARQAGRVVAVDMTPAMVQRASKACAGLNVTCTAVDG